jgi:hypothetical protein
MDRNGAGNDRRAWVSCQTVPHLSEEQCEWFEQGLGGAMACSKRDTAPFIMRVFAARACADRSALQFCVIRSDAERLLDTLRDNAEVSVTLADPPTYRSLQFKGPCAVLPHAPDPDWVEECLQRSDAAFVKVGLRPGEGMRFLDQYANPRDMLLLELTVRDVFDQTPGPDAGARV